MTKQCTKCKETKELTKFGTRSNRANNPRSWCNSCEEKGALSYKQRHPDKAKLYSYKASRTPGARFQLGKAGAKKRGISWELTLEQYRVLILQNKCHYCDSNLSETGCGLDRTNNNLGYILSNVVPCCGRCNDMKGQFLTYDEMIMLWNLRKLNLGALLPSGSSLVSSSVLPSGLS